MPAPEVTTVSNSDVDCEVGTVDTWDTITTTPYVLIEEGDGWMLDTANAVITETDRVTSEATAEQLAECPAGPVEPDEDSGLDAGGVTSGPIVHSQAKLPSTGFALSSLWLVAGAGMTIFDGLLFLRRTHQG